MFGKLEKLKIIDANGPRSFTALINPQEFKEAFAIEYQQSKAHGRAKKQLKFKEIKPEEFSFDLLLDTTNVISNDIKIGGNILAMASSKSIAQQIKDLKDVVLNYKGKKHQSNTVKLIWGKNKLRGRLTKMNISYSLFSPDGVPIRAKVKLNFKGSVDSIAAGKMMNNSSPDLTHIVRVKDGDHLPLMTKRIYGSAQYYLEVARVNKLRHFRDLRAGQELIFPPLDKFEA